MNIDVVYRSITIVTCSVVFSFFHSISWVMSNMVSVRMKIIVALVEQALQVSAKGAGGAAFLMSGRGAGLGTGHFCLIGVLFLISLLCLPWLYCYKCRQNAKYKKGLSNEVDDDYYDEDDEDAQPHWEQKADGAPRLKVNAPYYPDSPVPEVPMDGLDDGSGYKKSNQLILQVMNPDKKNPFRGKSALYDPFKKPDSYRRVSEVGMGCPSVSVTALTDQHISTLDDRPNLTDTQMLLSCINTPPYQTFFKQTLQLVPDSAEVSRSRTVVILHGPECCQKFIQSVGIQDIVRRLLLLEGNQFVVIDYIENEPEVEVRFPDPLTFFGDISKEAHVPKTTDHNALFVIVHYYPKDFGITSSIEGRKVLVYMIEL